MSRARIAGAITAAALGLGLVLAVHPPPSPWAQTLHIDLEAAAPGQLSPAAEVELGGVRAGSVDGMDWQDGHALIRLTVDAAYASLLHADASATIQPHGLLGPRYVALAGGTRGTLNDGAVIPAARVHVLTDLDQVLSALQPDVRQSLATIILELGAASAGRGTDVNAALAALGRANDDLATVAAALRQGGPDAAGSIAAAEQLNRDLQSAPIDAQVRDTDRVLSGLVAVDSSIGDGIDRTASVLRALDVVLDGNSDNLARLLAQAPGTVERLRAFAVAVDGVVQGVNPAVPSLMTAIVETESAFGGSDANGHFVRIQALTGACTIGLAAGCAAGSSGLPLPAPSSASQPAAAPSSPSSRLSDQELLRLFLGNN